MRRWLILGALAGCLAVSLALGVTSAGRNGRTSHPAQTAKGFFSITNYGQMPLTEAQPSNFDAIGYGTWQHVSAVGEKKLRALIASIANTCKPGDGCIVLTQVQSQPTLLPNGSS